MNYSQDIIWIMTRGEIMVNNNMNINLNSTVPLNGINYKSNQHQKSFPYEYNKIQLKMLQRDGVVMVEMKVLVNGDDDDDPDEVRCDGDDDDDDLPSPGRNFLGRFLSAGELFSLWCFPPRRGGGV
jgi:hypothetical protein